jgi:hypothetical protein
VHPINEVWVSLPHLLLPIALVQTLLHLFLILLQLLLGGRFLAGALLALRLTDLGLSHRLHLLPERLQLGFKLHFDFAVQRTHSVGLVRFHLRWCSFQYLRLGECGGNF